MRALDEQIRLAERMQAGERYTPTVPRWEVDPATGERRRIEWPRRLYAWFWQVDGRLKGRREHGFFVTLLPRQPDMSWS